MIEEAEVFNEKSSHFTELCSPFIGRRNLSDGTFVLNKTIGAFAKRGLRIEDRGWKAKLSSILYPQSSGARIRYNVWI